MKPRSGWILLWIASAAFLIFAFADALNAGRSIEAVVIGVLAIPTLVFLGLVARHERLRQRGTLTRRRVVVFGLITLCLCVLIVVLPIWTGVSPYLVFVIAWAILLALLILLPKRP